MVAHRYFASRILILIIFNIITYSLAESNSNIHLFKKEISEALTRCINKKDSRSGIHEEFERSNMQKEFLGNKNYDTHLRKKRNENLYDEIMNSAGDSASTEWNYKDYKKNGKENSWTNPKDNKYRIDNIYSYDPRAMTYDKESSIKNRNDSKIVRKNENNQNNRYASEIKNQNGGESQSMKYLNVSKNLYDPFLIRTKRFTQQILRIKRFGELLNKASQEECLSQCVFDDLQIVDEKGIPKESLFLKMVRDTIMSQQSRVVIERLIQTCFRELLTESEEYECSYSNALERCMDLQLKNRISLANETKLNDF